MSGLFDGLKIPTKRRVFFSFHYDDILKVNPVRNSWLFVNPEEHEDFGFYDASIWEKSKRESPESLKSLIRDGIKNTSVTCVLAGQETFLRRWVRYEIARSVIKGNGLLTVHINLIGDRLGYVTGRGPNPLDYMGVYREYDGFFYLAEMENGEWKEYPDYTLSVTLPSSWAAPTARRVVPLSSYAAEYCYLTNSGENNFSLWVRQAALEAGN